MKPSVCIGAVLIILAGLFSGSALAAKAQQDFSQGFELIKAGKLKEAAAKFENGLKAQPGNAQAHFYLAEAYLGLKQSDKAKAHYEQSLALDPNSTVAQQARDRLESLSGRAVGSEFQDCKTCPVMVGIPPGQFIMGSPPSEPGRASDEGPPHMVKISRPFAVGKFEVTFVEWNACVADKACSRADDQSWGQGRRPVINVSYEQAVGYTEWLAEKTGKRYRLLSEAEWEYAARAGSNEAYFWGSAPEQACQFANVANPGTKAKYNQRFNGVYDKHPPFDCDDGYIVAAPVGSFKPNAFGLYDMLGNVWEWVEDCYNKSYEGAPTDGKPWNSGDCSLRVRRGGSWVNDPAYVRSATRLRSGPSGRDVDLGLRVARTLP